MEDPPYGLIRERLQTRRAVPFLGAGASLVGRTLDSKWTSPQDPYFPSAGELAGFLVRHFSELSAGNRSDFDDLARSAQYVEVLAGPQQLKDDLRTVFQPVEPQPSPGRIHRYLAACPADLLIMTTNYDTLIEQAFDEAGRGYEVVIYDNADPKSLWVRQSGEGSLTRCPLRRYELAEHVTTIYKMHGSVAGDAKLDSFVVTDDDYVRFLWRMTEATAIPAALAERVRLGCFLFLGYSLRDWNFRVLLYELAQKYRAGYQSWSVQRGALAVDHDFWLKRDVKIYNVDLDAFARRLAGDPE